MSEETKGTVTVQKKPIDNIRDMLERSKGQIAMALPRHMNADRMLRIAVTACQKTPKLLECRPVSLIGAIIQCAQLGLEPNDGTGRAWLIPYGSEVQFIPGYRGLVDLARRSGDIKRFDVRAVYTKDKFSYSFGLKPDITHVPAEGLPGELTHVYAVAEYKDGGLQFDVMSKADVDAIRKRSKASSSGPWVTDYAEMAKKTIVRRICKMLPLAAEVAQAVTLDERAELGLPQNLAMLADPNEKPQPDPETYKEPEMTKEAETVKEPVKPAGIEATFKVYSVAKTDLAGEEAFVIKDTAETPRKFYTDKKEHSDLAKAAKDSDVAVLVLYIERTVGDVKVFWLLNIVRALAAKKA